MNVQEAVQITGGLSKPSKMPGLGYGIPATACKIGTTLRKQKGSVCNKCYARKGRYTFSTVQNAQAIRLKALTHGKWCEAMSFLINRASDRGLGYFRWHDSGDLQGITHLKKVVQVCTDTPGVRHWLPTKEYALIAKLKQVPANMVIRLSAYYIDTIPTIPASLKNKSNACTCTIHTGPDVFDADSAYICPAPTQGGRCGDCRACWDPSVYNVSYHKH